MSDRTKLVRDYMSASVRAVFPCDRLDVARDRLLEWDISALAVIEDDGALRLRGVISRTDLVRVAESTEGRDISDGQLRLPDRTVETAMTEDVICVHEGDSLVTAANLMTKHRVHRVFVEGSNGVVGVLSTRDVMRAASDLELEVKVSNYMSSPVVALHAKAPVSDAIEAFDKEGISTVIVLEKGWPCGVFTKHDALRARGEVLSEVMDAEILVVPESTALHRAASKAASANVRCIIVSRASLMVGVMSCLDVCRAFADSAE